MKECNDIYTRYHLKEHSIDFITKKRGISSAGSTPRAIAHLRRYVDELNDSDDDKDHSSPRTQRVDSNTLQLDDLFDF